MISRVSDAEFAKACAELQAGCICRTWDAQNCYLLRHGLDDDEACSCGCHDAILALEEGEGDADV